MARDDRRQAVLARGARRAHRREDAAALRVELLVARARRAERELLDTVAAERRVRVAVDEPGNRAQTASVELAYVAVERRQVAHATNSLDRVAGAEYVRVLEHVDVAERGSAQRCLAPRGRRELREIADEQPRAGSHASCGADGIRSPPRTAASIASG